MTRTLTVDAEAQRTASERGVRLVIEIDWLEDDSWIGKYADQNLIVGGDTYLPYVKEAGPHNTSVDLVARGSADLMKIRFKNSDEPDEKFYDICATYQPEGKPLRIGIHFTTTVEADVVWLFRGFIDKVSETSVDGTDIDAYEIGLRLNRELPAHEVNTTDFPDAPDASIGKALPLVYGDIQKFPAIPVTSAASTELLGTHGPADDVIHVYDSTGFPSSGIIVIEDEHISYGGINTGYSWMGQTVHAFINCDRHVNNTDAASHSHNVTVREDVTKSIFVVADHAVRDISGVRVENQLADAAKYVINKVNTSLITGRTVASVTFLGKATYLKPSNSVAFHRVVPDSAGTDNEHSEHFKCYDEPESHTYCRLAPGTVVSVRRVAAVDASDLEASDVLGYITRAWAAIEFEVGDDFGAGELQAKVGLDTEFNVGSDQDVVFDHDCSIAYSEYDPGVQTTNYNGALDLETDQFENPAGYDNSQRFYARITSGNVPANYGGITLRLKTKLRAGLTPLYVSPSASTFDEATLTWINQPNTTDRELSNLSIIAEFTPAGVGVWNEIHLPPGIDTSKGVVVWSKVSEWLGAVDFYKSEDATSANRPHFRFHFKDPDAFDLWDPLKGHERPSYDTFVRTIQGQHVDEVANVADDWEMTNYAPSWLTITENAGSPGTPFRLPTPSYYNAGASWDSYAAYMKATISGETKTYVTSIEYRHSGTPDEGTIKRVRCLYKIGRDYGGHASISFNLMTEGEILSVPNVYDGAQHYSDWIDLAEKDYDLATLVAHADTFIEVTPVPSGDNDDTVKIYFIGFEFEYRPTGGSNPPASDAPSGTVTNYIDLFETINLADEIVRPLDKTVVPAHDASVMQAAPNTNYGTATALTVRGTSANKKRIYLRLDTRQLPAASFDYVRLYMCVKTGTAGTVTLKCAEAAHGNWIESEAVLGYLDGFGGLSVLKWTNQPNGTADTPTGDLIGTKSNPAAGSWVYIDISSSVDLRKGICIYCDDDAEVTFYSTEETNSVFHPFFRLERTSKTSLGSFWAWFSDAEFAVRNNSLADETHIHNMWFEVEYIPIRIVDSDNVTCDVQGVEADGDGTGTLLENPAAIIEDILLNRLGWDPGRLHAASFAAAESSLTDFGALFGFGLDKRSDAWALIADLVYFARCWFFCDGDGAYHLAFRPPTYNGSVRTLSGSGVTGRLPGTGKIQPLGRAEIVNNLVLLYDQDYTKDADPYARMVTVADSVSQALYGERKRVIEAWPIRSGAFARNFAEYVLDREKNARAIYNEQTYIGNIDLELGDIVTISDSRWNLAEPAELVQVRYHPGSARDKRMHALELFALLEPHTYYWGSTTAGVIISGANVYIIIGGVCVARGTSGGEFRIKGRVFELQTLAASAGYPLTWNSPYIEFALTNGTTVFCVDSSGNLLLPEKPFEMQTLSAVGDDNEIDSDATDLWVQVDGARIVEAEALWNDLLTRIIEMSRDSDLM